MPVRAADAVRHYQQRHREAMNAAAWFEQVARKTQVAGNRAKNELDVVSVELAAAYLPGLTLAHLQRVEQLTGFVGFKRRDPLKAKAREQSSLEHTVTRIEADPRYQQRDILAGPDGTLGAKLAEAQEMIAPFANECAKFEVLPLFLELVQVGYDTPDFKEGWWTGDYWKHWSAGDEICQALGMNDFGDDVLPAYRKVATQRDFWQREINQLQAKVNEVHELVRHHDQAKARIPMLAHLYLEQSQSVLAEHLRQADVQLLEEWRKASAPDDRSIQVGLRKLAGLRAKFEILRELHDKGLQLTVTELKARAAKYQRKTAKFSRAKYQYRAVGENELDNGFGAKLSKLQDRQQKMASLIARIDNYNDYDRFDLDNDQELWWYELSGGKRPPRQLGRLTRYYARNPSMKPERDRIEVPVAVQRAAAEIPVEDDIGYLS